jgi:DNA-binding transcriptional MocR family regulator
MLADLHIEENSPVPIYRQLFEAIAGAIRSGEMPAGHRLPPTRELASRLRLNRTTVASAYELLEAENYIRGQVGRGSYVQEGHAQPVISFSSSRSEVGPETWKSFQQACTEVLADKEAPALLQLGAPSGLAALRQYILEKALADGEADPDDSVLVTSGCQQAMDLFGRLCARWGRPVLLEDPVYHGTRNAFAAAGARVLALDLTATGPNLSQLAQVCAAERPGMIVLTPNFQNPTGLTMDGEARRGVAEIASAHGISLIENDPYGGLRYTGSSQPSMKAMAPASGTFLVRSFSKIAFGGLRVGWIIGPSSALAELTAIRQWCDLHTDQLAQAIFLRFAKSGGLEQHLRRVREEGRRRLDAVLAGCREHLPAGAEWTHPEGGMNLWVRLPRGLDAAEVQAEAQQTGVTFLPGTHFTVWKPQTDALRLSFGGLSPVEIREGLARLGRACSRAMSRRDVRAAADLPALV